MKAHCNHDEYSLFCGLCANNEPVQGKQIIVEKTGSANASNSEQLKLYYYYACHRPVTRGGVWSSRHRRNVILCTPSLRPELVCLPPLCISLFSFSTHCITFVSHRCISLFSWLLSLHLLPSTASSCHQTRG